MVPSLRVDESGRPAPALVRAFGHPEYVRMRSGALAALATLDPGCGLVELDALRELLAHRAPYDREIPGDAERLRATLAEAELLGLVATGALTPLGRQLLAAVHTDDPHAALRDALVEVLPAPSRTATFLPDLTAVVTGTAAAPLTRLLDTVADTERRDTASVWRFTAESVRRALDAGYTADRLLAELTDAADRPLPQPLEYLDPRRRPPARADPGVRGRHVRPRSPTPRWGRSSRPSARSPSSRLRLLADTVLVSERPVAEVLDALRSAGYAPVQQDATGATVVTRPSVRRAAAPAEQQWPGTRGRCGRDRGAAQRRCVGTRRGLRGCAAPAARPPW